MKRFVTARRSLLFSVVFLLLAICAFQLSHPTSVFEFKPWYETYIAEKSTLGLIEECPQPLENVSEECLGAMNDQFSEWPLEWPDTTWILLPNRLTLGRAFEDPIGDRARVFEALQKEECRLESGETVRWDLKDSCHATAFANLSVFLWACSEPKDLRMLYEEVIDASHKAHQEPTNIQRYKSKLHSSIVRLLRARWVNGQCEKYQVPEIQVDSQRDQEQHELLRKTAIRLDTYGQLHLSEKRAAAPEAFVLKALAARLGDESAAMLYHGPAHGSEDSWEKQISKELPWRFKLREIRGDPSRDLSLGRPQTTQRLQLGVSLAKSLTESGLEFDWNFLVREVSERKKPEESTCQAAIAELRGTRDWDRKEWEALGKFERVSIDLGLFD